MEEVIAKAIGHLRINIKCVISFILPLYYICPAEKSVFVLPAAVLVASIRMSNGMVASPVRCNGIIHVHCNGIIHVHCIGRISVHWNGIIPVPCNGSVHVLCNGVILVRCNW